MRLLKLRLRTMMFLQFFLNGTTLPILSLYLRDFLHFSGAQTGLVIGMSAASSFISPVLASLVADRFLRAERLFGLCHLGGGILMLVLSFQHRFMPVLLVYLLYVLVYGPTNALTNVITLHHSKDVRRGFGGIRLWGTVGWVAVAWLFGYFWLRGGGGAHLSERLPNALPLSSIISFLLAAYSFALPRSPARLDRGGRALRGVGDRRPRLFPREALAVLMEPQVALFVAVSFLVYAMDTYYYFGTPLFLVHLTVPADSIMPLMSTGQIVEVGAMAVLGLLLARYSYKRVLIAGIAMELVRFTLLAVGSPFGVVVTALAVHGLCFGLFFATAPIFLDSRSSIETRAGVQQFYTIATTGLGTLVGNLSAGHIFDAANAGRPAERAFQEYWSVPAAVALLAGLVMVFFFREVKPRRVMPVDPNGSSYRP